MWLWRWFWAEVQLFLKLVSQIFGLLARCRVDWSQRVNPLLLAVCPPTPHQILNKRLRSCRFNFFLVIAKIPLNQDVVSGSIPVDALSVAFELRIMGRQ